MVFVQQCLVKYKSQILIIVLLDLQLPLFAVRLLDQHHHIFFIDQIMVIKHILQFMAIDR